MLFFFSKESNLKTSRGLMGKRWTDLSKGQSEPDRESERDREANKWCFTSAYFSTILILQCITLIFKYDIKKHLGLHVQNLSFIHCKCDVFVMALTQQSDFADSLVFAFPSSVLVAVCLCL